MRIGLSASVLDPAYNNGRPDGMSVCTRHLLAGLTRLGHEVRSVFLYRAKRMEARTGAAFLLHTASWQGLALLLPASAGSTRRWTSSM